MYVIEWKHPEVSPFKESYPDWYAMERSVCETFDAALDLLSWIAENCPNLWRQFDHRIRYVGNDPV
jgi:hypothetical protein